MARRLGAAPSSQGFGNLAAQADARRVVVIGKMVRPAGLAPAFPDWKSGILLLDDDRIVKNKNKHRCQSGDGLAPAGKFLGGSFGVSGTPPVTRTIYKTVMSKPLVCISSRVGIRDKTGPSASHDLMTHLTVDLRAATVIAVVHSPSVSLGDLLDCRPIPPRRQLLLTAGFFAPDWFVSKKSCQWKGLV